MLNYMILILAVAMYFAYSPYFHQIEPLEYSTSLPLTYEGPMAVNDKLAHVEKAYKKMVHWPESLAVYKGKIYSGLGDGRIVSFSEVGLTNITRMGIDCQGQHEEHLCGRPLGLKVDKFGHLYVADGYLGLYMIDLETKKKTQILPSHTHVASKPLTFLNGLALDEEQEVLYFTQSSTKWNISKVVVSIVEHDTTGRLLKYDIRHKTLSVLATDLSFPNGVILSHDKKSLLVAEGNKNRIHRYYIKGPEKGQMKVMPLLLPGEPDNLSYSPRGNYWVSAASPRTANSPTIYDRFSHYPLIRKGFLVAYHILVSPIASALRLMPSRHTKELAFELIGLRAMADLFVSHSVLIEFDENGSIVQSLHSSPGGISHISEVLEHDGYLYFGSWRNHFLGRMKFP